MYRITRSDGGVDYYRGGKKVTEAEYYRLPTKKRQGWQRPLESDALAVHPDLRDEATKDAKYKGVPTEFNGDGCPIFTSEVHKRKYLKAYGYMDRTQIKRTRRFDTQGRRKKVTYFIPKG